MHSWLKRFNKQKQFNILTKSLRCSLNAYEYEWKCFMPFSCWYKGLSLECSQQITWYCWICVKFFRGSPAIAVIKCVWMCYHIYEKRKSSDSILWQKPLRPLKNKKINVTTQNATKNFDFTTIVDRLRTASWSNDSQPTGVVKPVYGNPTFPFTTKAV